MPQRFIPSKFGLDPTRVQVFVLEDGYNFYAPKVEIRRLVEAEGIPYTFISCNFFVRILLPSLAQPSLDAPPRDKVTIFFYGNIKGLLHQSRSLFVILSLGVLLLFHEWFLCRCLHEVKWCCCIHYQCSSRPLYVKQSVVFETPEKCLFFEWDGWDVGY